MLLWVRYVPGRHRQVAVWMLLKVRGVINLTDEDNSKDGTQEPLVTRNELVQQCKSDQDEKLNGADAKFSACSNGLVPTDCGHQTLKQKDDGHEAEVSFEMSSSADPCCEGTIAKEEGPCCESPDTCKKTKFLSRNAGAKGSQSTVMRRGDDFLLRAEVVSLMTEGIVQTVYNQRRACSLCCGEPDEPGDVIIDYPEHAGFVQLESFDDSWHEHNSDERAGNGYFHFEALFAWKFANLRRLWHDVASGRQELNSNDSGSSTDVDCDSFGDEIVRPGKDQKGKKRSVKNRSKVSQKKISTQMMAALFLHTAVLLPLHSGIIFPVFC